jgi:hypothetical protein
VRNLSRLNCWKKLFCFCLFSACTAGAGDEAAVNGVDRVRSSPLVVVVYILRNNRDLLSTVAPLCQLGMSSVWFSIANFGVELACKVIEERGVLPESSQIKDIYIALIGIETTGGAEVGYAGASGYSRPGEYGD